MADEKHMHHGGHLLFTVGILAIVYGIMQYLMVGMNLPPYAAWIIGGILIVLVAWWKKSMWVKRE